MEMVLCSGNERIICKRLSTKATVNQVIVSERLNIEIAVEYPRNVSPYGVPTPEDNDADLEFAT